MKHLRVWDVGDEKLRQDVSICNHQLLLLLWCKQPLWQLGCPFLSLQAPAINLSTKAW